MLFQVDLYSFSRHFLAFRDLNQIFPLFLWTRSILFRTASAQISLLRSDHVVPLMRPKQPVSVNLHQELVLSTILFLFFPFLPFLRNIIPILLRIFIVPPITNLASSSSGDAPPSLRNNSSWLSLLSPITLAPNLDSDSSFSVIRSYFLLTG